MNLNELLFRGWFYFRLGYNTYLAFLAGFCGYIVSIYYLAIKSSPVLNGIFIHFTAFAFCSLLLFIPVSVFLGWSHMKRTAAFPSEVSVSVEANPYNYIIMPGKEREIWAPLDILILRCLGKILEKEDLLSSEEKKEIEIIKTKMNRLLSGEIIGNPEHKKVIRHVKNKK